MPLTITGVEESVLAPFPSWPEPLFPKHCTVLPLRTAQVYKLPDAIAVAVVIPVTVIGEESKLHDHPQHCTVPVLRALQVWKAPAAMAVAVVIPLAGTGAEELVLVPFPS